MRAETVVTWGFDDVEPGVERGYRAAVAARLPGLTLLDGAPAASGSAGSATPVVAGTGASAEG